MTDWVKASVTAAKTAKWSITMTRWLIARLKVKTAWNLVTFVGPQGRESAGIVDILAVRKNHAPADSGLKRGDVFEIILIQVKGGSARWPSWDDINRLRIVSRRYRAKATLLAEWKKGAQPRLYRLRRVARIGNPPTAWVKIEAPGALFD